MLFPANILLFSVFNVSDALIMKPLFLSIIKAIFDFILIALYYDAWEIANELFLICRLFHLPAIIYSMNILSLI